MNSVSLVDTSSTKLCSNQTTPSKTNFTHIRCITCLSKDNDLIPVSDDILAELAYLSDVVATTEKMICKKCRIQLASACHFKRQCIFSKKMAESSCNNEFQQKELTSCYMPLNKITYSSVTKNSSKKIVPSRPKKAILSNKRKEIQMKTIRRMPKSKKQMVFVKKEVKSQQLPSEITLKAHSNNETILQTKSSHNPADYFGQVCREVFSTMDAFKKYKSEHFCQLTNLFVDKIPPKITAGHELTSSATAFKEKNKLCSFCGKGYKQLNKHILICPLVKQNSVRKLCEKCGKVLTNLGKHKCPLQTSSPSQPKLYSCETCGKIFNQYKSLWSHKKNSHSDFETKKKLDCTKCSKSYTNASARREHMMTKHGNTPLPHSCNMCSKQFPSTTKLKRHLATHDNLLSYECFICLASFSETADLAKHLKTEHNNIFQQPHKVSEILMKNH